MESNAQEKLDVNNFDETIDFDIPDLYDLYDKCFINIVSDVYLEYKQECDKTLLADYEDKLAIICVAYYSIIKLMDEDNISEEQLEYFICPSFDDLDKVKGILKRNCVLVENELNLQKKSRENDQMDYAREVIAINLLFERDEEVLKFMKLINNHNVNAAVKSYFLAQNLRLENMGITPIENIYEDTKYFVYSYFYKLYLECSSGYSKARKMLSKYIPNIDENIVILRNLTRENAIEAVTNCLDELNGRLYTENEFYIMRDSRRYNFKIIFNFANEQYEKLKKEIFYNERSE